MRVKFVCVLQDFVINVFNSIRNYEGGYGFDRGGKVLLD